MQGEKHEENNIFLSFFLLRNAFYKRMEIAINNNFFEIFCVSNELSEVTKMIIFESRAGSCIIYNELVLTQEKISV